MVGTDRKVGGPTRRYSGATTYTKQGAFFHFHALQLWDKDQLHIALSQKPLSYARVPLQTSKKLYCISSVIY